MYTLFNNNLINPLFLETNLFINGQIIDNGNRYKVSINNNDYYFNCKNLDNTEKPLTVSHGRFFLYLLYKISVSKTNEIYITYEEYRQFRQIKLLSDARKEFNQLFQPFRNLTIKGKYDNKSGESKFIETRFLDSWQAHSVDVKTNLKQDILFTSKGITMVINSDFFDMVKDSFFFAIPEDIFTYNLKYNEKRYLLILKYCYDFRLNHKKTISKKFLERIYNFNNISSNRNFARVREQLKKDFDYFIKSGFLKSYTLNNFKNVNSKFSIDITFSKEVNIFFQEHKTEKIIIVHKTRKKTN